MTIDNDQKSKIEAEYRAWESCMYAGKGKDSRQALGQFFTPPVLSIKMAEKFDTFADKDVLDPTAGAGGLLAVAVICGATPSRVYGVELDPDVANICRVRLAKLGVPRHNIHVGNALDQASYEFAKSSKTFNLKLSRNGKNLHAGLEISSRDGKALKNVDFDITSNDGKVVQKNLVSLHKALKTLVCKEIEGLDDSNKNITLLDKLFVKSSLPEI